MMNNEKYLLMTIITLFVFYLFMIELAIIITDVSINNNNNNITNDYIAVNFFFNNGDVNQFFFKPARIYSFPDGIEFGIYNITLKKFYFTDYVRKENESLL